jgi:hypothetical protein
MFIPSALIALALSVPSANAATSGYVPRAVLLDLEPGVLDAVRVSVIVPSNDGTVAEVSAEVQSDGGAETVALTESDTRLHGAALIKALPAKEATLSLTVYDVDNAVLASFTATLSATGALTRMKRADFCGTGDPTTTADLSGCSSGDADIETLTAELFPAEGGGWDVAVDLHGADTYDIAYADVTLTESEKTTTTAEVGWDTLDAVWEGALTVAHEGLIEVKAKTYDADGKKLGAAKVKLGSPWQDGGAGAPTLATDEDPLTRVALLSDEVNNNGTRGFFVVSDGWSVTDTLPIDAEVDLEGGETLTLPVNSYQVAALAVPSLKVELEAIVITHLKVNINGGTLTLDGSSALSLASLSSPVCANGTCVALREDSLGGYALSVTAYSSKASALPKDTKVGITALDRGGKEVASDTVAVTFEDDVTVVFANEVSLAADPVGLGLSGVVRLLGAPNKKGKQATLSKGAFYGSLTRDADGELALSGADKDEVQSKGDILIGGEPIDFELTDTNKDGVIEAPPVIQLLTSGNGKGTRAVTTTSTVNPGLL